MPGASDEPLEESVVSSDPEQLLEVTPGRPWRDLGNRILLFDQREGIEIELSGSGVILWRLIAPRRPTGEVADELAAMLGHDSPELREAMSFITRLIDEGVLRRA